MMKNLVSTGVCILDRSVLAEACCKQLINESGLGDFVDCESKVRTQDSGS